MKNKKIKIWVKKRKLYKHNKKRGKFQKCYKSNNFISNLNLNRAMEEIDLLQNELDLHLKTLKKVDETIRHLNVTDK